MAFCSKCGTQVAEGVKFCTSCGTPIGGAAAPVAPAAKPAKEKVGNILVCPSCGAPLESFQGKCPSCGHELRNVEVNAGVKKFFDEIAKIDNKVEESASAKRGSGLSNFGIGALIFIALAYGLFLGFMTSDMSTFNTSWIVILLCLAGIFAILLFRKPRWTKEDQKKQALVDNLIVPNEKESISEFFLFATTNIVKVNSAKSLLSVSERYHQKWNMIWSRKCKQLYTKASMALSDDTALIKRLDTMLAETIVSQKKQNRTAAVFIGVVAVVLIVGGIIFANVQSKGGIQIAAEIRRLEAIEVEIKASIKNGVYDKALSQVKSLDWGLPAERYVSSSEKKKYKENEAKKTQQTYWKTQKEHYLDTLDDLQGTATKIPESAVIAAANVTIQGSLSDCFRVVGNCTLKADASGDTITVSFEVRSLKSAAPIVKQRIDEYIRGKNWGKDNCTREMKSASVKVADFSASSEDGKAVANSLILLTPGSSTKISIQLTPSSDKSAREKRAATASFMSQDTLGILLTPTYEIINQTILSEYRSGNKARAKYEMDAKENLNI